MAQMTSAEYDVMARVEADHWWYRTIRSMVVDELAASRFTDGDSLLDVGCGTGGTFESVRRRFPGVRYLGIDVDEKALGYSDGRGIWGLARATADGVPFRDSCVNAIVCLDVLYFSSISREKAVAGFYGIMKPGGCLILNLPAFSSLSGEHDRAVGITRRFRRPELVSMLSDAGFKIIRATYWNMALSLPLLIWRPLSRLMAKSQPRSDLEKTPKVLNALLGALVGVESRLTRLISLPFGSSVFIVAEKPLD